ncbi:hypothetical protein B296_00027174 [Ensete ventricosum]|uniref:Auxin-responsive protein n=1 Tax=Ensete ventricosum TaxID=4639 RepID=A0A426Y5W4_ENSVE|nr:hypothetical protein B296_00027174 [Ensete ventricosum]
MSPPLEHDYIGLSEVPSAADGEEGALNLKATELRLGLPGSESPDRKDKVGLTLELLPRGFVSGAKRGFSDAIDGAGKWSFASGESGSEVELGKGGGLFSPRGEPVAGASGGQLSGQGTGGKDAAAKAAAQERKAAVQVGSSVGYDRAMAPAAK